MVCGGLQVRRDRRRKDTLMLDYLRCRRGAAIWRGLGALLLIGSLLTIAGHSTPARAQEETETDATLRVVHASPGAPNLDVLVDGQAIVQDLVFGAATEYFPLAEGDHQVQIVPTGQGADAALVDTDLNVDSGDAYVFVAMNRLNEIEGKVFDVNLDSVDAGKARVRVIHASPDAGEIDVAVTGGDELFGGVNFTDATDYNDLDAGSYNLDVKGDGDRVLLTAQNLEIADGNAYDLLLIGQVADNSLALLPLATIVSIPCAEVLGLEGGTDDACIRIVHAAPSTPEVDIYLNDSPVVTGLAFGTSTEFVAVPSGDDRKIQVTAAGGTPGDGDLLDTDTDFDSRAAYEVIVTGNPDDLEATTAELDLSPLPDGQARIRVIHASPDAEEVDVAVADGPTLYEDVDFRDVTDFSTIDAGAYNLQLMKDDTIALAGDVTFDAGMVYDVVVIGRADDNTLSLLVLSATALVREGEVATPEAQGTSGAGTAEATVVDATTAPSESTVVPTAGAVEATPTT
jgi:hypothetical protein